MNPRPPRALAEAPAYWLAASAFLSVAALVGDTPAAWAQPAGWRAAVGPLALALGEAVAAVRLLTGRGSGRLATAALAVQVVAVSAGPLAYRLVAGPYVTLAAGSEGWQWGAGVDAHLMWIAGAGNRVPPGLALNVAALLALAVLLGTRPGSIVKPVA